MKKEELFSFKNTIFNDLSASLAVFLVAVPLCLGIAHASGVPLISGLVAGIIGGIVIGLISKSPLSVSGPAAGLTAVILASLATLENSLPQLFMAVFLSGLIQIGLGIFRLGFISSFIPNSVIKGMLVGIGLIIIFKQFPHMIGYDIEEFASLKFQFTENELNEGFKGEVNESNTFTIFLHSLKNIQLPILIVGILSIFIMVIWDKTLASKIKTLPGSLIAVLIGTVLSLFFSKFTPNFSISNEHLVNLPNLTNNLSEALIFPDWNSIFNVKVITVAFTIAIIASIETLLSIEAIDKLDPFKRKTPKDRELLAQGVGNSLSGLLGGLPVTSVIVRSSVNVSAGGITNKSTILHGTFLLLAVLFFSSYINLIPLATLSAVLVYTGYKLAHPKNFKDSYLRGNAQFIPYISTVLGVLFTDLLKGVIIGILVSVIYTLKSMFKIPVNLKTQGYTFDLKDNEYVLELNDNISFFHKPQLIEILSKVPDNATLKIINKAKYIDRDILDILDDFSTNSITRNIKIENFASLKDLTKV